MTRFTLCVLLMSCGAHSKAVVDTAGARAAKGTHVEIHGKAANAKLAAAVILTDGTPVYCLGTESWPRELDGKSVVAAGTLESTDEFAAGPGEAGTNGPVWVLRDCKYGAP